MALALGSIGIYGMVAYRVAQRTAEIGIRMALGAQRPAVVWLVMRDTVGFLGAGAIAGIPVALAAARLIRSILFGLGPSDPGVVAFAIAALIPVGLLAAMVPARRAATIDLTRALRYE